MPLARPSPAPSARAAFLLAAAVAIGGWCATWFLCDDAFIAFRYVGNAHDGHGLVWNPAPFAPVEGYSCFLWVVLLGAVWSLTGVEPPVAANWLALGCGLLGLWSVARRAAALVGPGPGGGGWLVVLVLLGIAANHTVVTWYSSGLETALFGAAAIGWTLLATTAAAATSVRSLLGLATAAAVAGLTRPDGALLVLATLGIAALRVASGGLRAGAAGRGLVPLFAVVAHVVWRRARYGEWLPNTYYAKVVGAWPESGVRYLYCFALEHGLWLWLPLVAFGLVVACRRVGIRAAGSWVLSPALAAVVTWCAYVAYYTLVVGGDHFGWRPFAHLVPLLFLALLGVVVALRWRLATAAAALLAFGLAADSFGWWYDAAVRERPLDGFVRASRALPAPLGSLFTGWDRCMAWLRLRYVALPRPLHAATCDDLRVLLPARRAGQVEGLPAGVRGVYRTVAAGVVAWALPDVAILDAAGLNDWIVARHAGGPPEPTFDAARLQPLFGSFDTDGDGRLGGTEIAALAGPLQFAQTGVPVGDAAWADLLLAICDRDGDGLDRDEFVAAVGELGNQRHMAHERVPPPGYFEALRPNVVLDGGRFRMVPGVAPLTDAEVVAVEAEFRAKVLAR
jgi:arabinofuranosyltransferase